MEREARVRIVLDIETTGLDAYRDHIIEVAAVTLAPDLSECGHFSMLVNPGHEALASMSPEALAVHKIPKEECLKAKPTAEVARELREFIGMFSNSTIHSFPTEFERGFLTRFPWEVKDGWGECLKSACKDIMERAGGPEKLGGRKERWPSLSLSAKFFGVEQEGAHRALVDARAASRIYAEIIRQRKLDESNEEMKMIEEEGL